MNPFSPRPERQYSADTAEFMPTYSPVVDASFAYLHSICWMIDPVMLRHELSDQHREAAGRMATAGSQTATETITAVQEPEQTDNVYYLDSARRSVDEHVDSSADIEARRIIQGEEQRAA